MDWFSAIWAALLQFVTSLFAKKQQDDRDRKRDLIANYCRDKERILDSGIPVLIRHGMKNISSNKIALEIVDELKLKYDKNPLGKHSDLIINYNKENQVPNDPNNGVLGFFKRITLKEYNDNGGHIDEIITKWYDDAKKQK